MSPIVFVGRNQEQEQFRQILRQYDQPKIQQWLPTFSKLLQINTSVPQKPSILLVYGEGGMGKTTLRKRLEHIATQFPFSEKEQRKSLFQILSLDWEDHKTEPELSVGHDQIQPEAILEVLHRVIARSLGEVKTYTEKVEKLRLLENKVDQKLKEQLPESDEPLKKEVLDLGSKGLAWVVRTVAATQTGPVAAALSGAAIEPLAKVGLQLSAEGLSQARRLLQQALTPDEQELYARPHIQLAQTLGEGLATLSRRKPLVVFLDTYEIVDRRECDETLRKVIHSSAGNAIWIIAGRANLADSGQRSGEYFRGYRSEFSEQVYASGLREFGIDEIQDFFQQKAPERALSEKQAEKLSEFSLGIPFVINLAAEMWQQGVPFEEITAPPAFGESRRQNAHYRIIREMSERFLVHCLNCPEDKQLIYALAMLRRPDPNLLKAMLNLTDLEPMLQALRSRYSFIWAEELRLDEKLARFLGEYLLEPIRRADGIVQTLNQQALAWIELRLEQMTQGISDRADWLADETIAELLLDKIHHHFWQEDGIEDRCGWRALVPWLVEGWVYNRPWTRRLLEVAATFQSAFGSEQENHWLKLFREGLTAKPEPEEIQVLLKELDTLETRGWLKGLGENDRKAILVMQQGNLQLLQERYEQALETYLSVEQLLSDNAKQLRNSLSKALSTLGFKLGWKEGSAIASVTAKQVFEISVRLNDLDESAWRRLGIMQRLLKDYEAALNSFNKSISLSGGKTPEPFNSLGVLYKEQNRLDEAVDAYKKAVEVDANYPYVHNNLGNSYRDLKRFDEAVDAYKKAVEVDPSYVYAHNNLGNIYRDLKRFDEAVDAYKKAIEVDPSYAYVYNNLGNSYRDLKRFDEAVDAYKKAVEVDPSYVYAHNNLGKTYRYLKRFDEAVDAYKKAIEVAPSYAYAYNGLGEICAAQGFYEEAISAYRQAIKADPNWTTPFENSGWIYWLQGLYEESVECYKEAITLSCTSCNSNNFNSLGWLYLVLKDYEQAKEALLSSLKIKENWANLFNFALLHALQNNLEVAEEHWRKGLSICQTDSEEAKSARTFYLIALGNSEQGLNELQDLIENNRIPLNFKKILLLVAEVMQGCPQPISGADKVAEMLKQSMN